MPSPLRTPLVACMVGLLVASQPAWGEQVSLKVENYLFAASEALDDGEPALALSLLRRAKAEDPDCCIVQEYLCRCYAALENLDMARQSYADFVSCMKVSDEGVLAELDALIVQAEDAQRAQAQAASNQPESSSTGPSVSPASSQPVAAGITGEAGGGAQGGELEGGAALGASALDRDDDLAVHDEVGRVSLATGVDDGVPGAVVFPLHQLEGLEQPGLAGPGEGGQLELAQVEDHGHDIAARGFVVEAGGDLLEADALGQAGDPGLRAADQVGQAALARAVGGHVQHGEAQPQAGVPERLEQVEAAQGAGSAPFGRFEEKSYSPSRGEPPVPTGQSRMSPTTRSRSTATTFHVLGKASKRSMRRPSGWGNWDPSSDTRATCRQRNSASSSSVVLAILMRVATQPPLSKWDQPNTGASSGRFAARASSWTSFPSGVKLGSLGPPNPFRFCIMAARLPIPHPLALGLLTMALSCAVGCERFSPPEREEPEIPLDTQDSLADMPCEATTVGPFVTAVTHEAATVVMRTDLPCRVVVEVATGPDFGEVLSETRATGGAFSSDLTAHARLEGLEPSTTYFYRPRVGDVYLTLPSQRSFTTAPAPDETVEYTFAVVSDALTNDGNLTTSYENLALHQPAFVLQIGDLDHRDPGTMAPWDVETWRRMHRDQLAEYQAGQTLDRSVLAVTPFFHTWDDHDFGNNDTNGTAPWKDLALQAFQEYFPLPPDAPNPEQGIWYSFRWGQVEVFMLDMRSQRSPNGDVDSASKSMLDHFELEDGQKQWLKDSLVASTATWKILISSTCFNRYGKQEDSWAEFLVEQRELLQYFVDQDLTGLFVISGDIHSGGGIDDGTFGGLPEVTVPATNINLGNCTGGICGTWSEGIQVGDNPAGYASVSLSYDGDKGEHRATIKTWSEEGELRMTFLLTPDAAVVNQDPIHVEM